MRELYTRVMTDTQRAHLHLNTAKLLVFAEPIVQKNYLIQQHAISPALAKAIYEGLPADKRQGYTMDEVAEGAKKAHLVGKNLSFKHKSGRSFMGMPVPEEAVSAMKN